MAHRMAEGNMKDVPSDVMKNEKLTQRATRVSHGGEKKRKRPKGFRPTYRDAGDALAACG